MNDPIDEKLRAFYHERLLPIARDSYFPTAAENDAATYYIDRNDSGGYIYEIDATDLASELRAMWSGDSPELAEISDELTQLADLLQEKEETSEEVSPFIYAMF